ncbi:MAG: hypothetical protein KKA56_06155 [Gammaproteobacteria bacterium]|nr:hypothetical protein [Gammaproteobacteria bacterium]MBU2426443.1 hypothetical protein [Gammaproteobacteria bacterium]
MLKESASLLQLYQYLDRFYQQVKSPLDGAKLPLIAEQIALQLAKLCQQQPRLAFSQLALTPVNTMYVSQLAMKQSVLLSALASAGLWPSQVLEELLAANLFRLTGIVSQLSQPTLATEQHAQLSLQAGLHTLKAAGPDFQHRYWRQLLTDCSMSKHSKSSAQQVPYAAALMFCNEVSVKITPGMMKAANGLELAIQQLLQQPASAMHRYFAAQIASLGKTLLLTGRFCSDTIGEVALITAAEPTLSGHIFDLTSKKLQPHAIELSEPSLKLLPPRLIPSIQWLDLFVTSVREQPAPQTLSIAEIQQFNPNHSVRKQVAWLEQHEKLSHHILLQATKRTRQSLPIESLSHAVALIGADHLPQILRLGWLQQQIQQCQQPYQIWFTQLEGCLAQVWKLLAEHTDSVALSAADAELLAACFILALQQDERCRYLPLQPSNGKQSPLLQFSYQTCWQQADYPRQVSHSVASVGLPMIWQDGVLYFRQLVEIQNNYTQQQCAQLLISFGWLLVESLFYGVNVQPAVTENTFKNARHALDLPLLPWSHWLQLLSDRCGCYCPLQPDM